MDARQAIFEFRRALVTISIEWNGAVRSTGPPNDYVGQVLDAAFSQAKTVVGLAPRDDQVRLRDGFHGSTNPAHETDLTPQETPSVLFESGVAKGRAESRTVLEEFGQCRPFSDIVGRHAVRHDNSTRRRHELAKRLVSPGAQVEMFERDWHTTGNFQPPS